MQTLFRGEKDVGYSQFYLGTGIEPVEGWTMDDCFAGQRNGLCGAAERGQLVLITGLHTGNVPVTVELHDTAPPVPDAPDVVEVSFPITRGPVGLFSGFVDDHADLGLPPGFYRVRYSADGMDAARAMDCRIDDASALDDYLLQFWPAPAEPDRVVRTGSEIARHRHDNAAGLPSPTRTPSQRADDRARDPEHARQRAIELDLRRTGQRAPGPLGSIGFAYTLALVDDDLADHLTTLPPDRQRGLALRTAHRTVAGTGLDRVAWIGDVLPRLGQAPLPPVFLDESTALAALAATPKVPCTVVTSPDERRAPTLAQAMALPALAAVTHPDATVALLETVHHALAAAGEEGYRDVLADLRSASADPA
ncbi:hypothetical protein WY02_26725 [Pseudonocardia sp. AL041005-10]|nr:hypothetical protein [Pseudonocardia sp. AL041005-10]ALE81368.1 hypothetical protein WY02_26725 [Pseudonocardia sp. AL041005-10]